ncbi:hypothetical protein ABTW72_18980 [Micromonospora sp. NPDC127501]|uniref:hypothetical protein n=1 Tax=Micromonospora sp. NPDC127501 TaxID=3154872 RepID=UPI00331F0A14
MTIIGAVQADTDVWSWAWGAVGSVAAVASVVVALVVTRVQLKDLIRLRRREAQDRRREQAQRVSAWATSETDFPDTPATNIVGNPWYAAVHVLNASDSSISEVRVEIGYRTIDGHWYGLGETHEWPVVPPGERVRADFRQSHVRNFASPRNTLLCRLYFRDGSKVGWDRDALNHLTELDDRGQTAQRRR